MARLVRCGVATTLALLLAPADALVKVGGDVADPTQKVFSKATGPICGGDAIRQLVSTPASSSEVRNIPWTQVEAVADDFLRSQAAAIASLEAEVKRLREEIPRREASEAPAALADNQLAAAVTAAVATPAGYGTLDVAKASKCGAVFTKPRPPKNAYQAAKAAFEANIKSVLSSKTLRTTSGQVRAVCGTTLGVGPGDDPTSSCDELCQDLAELAQAASDSAAGVLVITGKASAQLRQEERAKTALLAAAVSDLEQCKQIKADLGLFKGQLKSLDADIKNKHEALMGARDSLLDAQEELQDAEQTLDAQLTASKAAADCFTASGREAEDARAQFQNVGQLVEVLQATLQAATGKLESAKQDVKKAELTAGLVFKLKKAVSESMLAMIMYFDEAVRKPIRDMGLGEQVDVNDLFPASLAALPSATATRRSMEALDGFCALPATQQVLQAVATEAADPRPLCTIGDVAKLEADIDEAVTERVESLKESLRSVQSWLCPYRGQPETTKEVVAQHIQAGEPVGLREVLSTFGRTAFYQQYLKNWMLKGRFLKLYDALVAAHSAAQDSHSQAMAQVQEVATELRQAEESAAAAQSMLQHALDSQMVAESKQMEAQQVLETLSANQVQLKRDLTALEDAVKEAERQWNAAKLALENTHREGVSLVQLLQELEDAWQSA